jgi:hypothetical protein
MLEAMDEQQKQAAPERQDHVTPKQPVAPAELVTTLSSGVKVKRRNPRMRACDERDAKGKICAGHLKRWYFFGPDVAEAVGGAAAEVYRCENCKTLYLPNLSETPRSGTLRW